MRVSVRPSCRAVGGGALIALSAAVMTAGCQPKAQDAKTAPLSPPFSLPSQSQVASSASSGPSAPRVSGNEETDYLLWLMHQDQLHRAAQKSVSDRENQVIREANATQKPIQPGMDALRKLVAQNYAADLKTMHSIKAPAGCQAIATAYEAFLQAHIAAASQAPQQLPATSSGEGGHGIHSAHAVHVAHVAHVAQMHSSVKEAQNKLNDALAAYYQAHPDLPPEILGFKIG